MNILILSEWGGGLAMGLRFKSEGHKVRMWIKDPKYAKVGDGLLDKIDDYKGSLGWADFIVADDAGFGKITEELRAKGHTVWGGTKLTDEWESERVAGQELFKKAGLTIAGHMEFSNADEAIRFVQQHPGRYVVKPDGKVQDEKSLTYVGESEDGSDLIATLEHYKKWGSKISSFEIQKHIDGVEVACSGFFNGHDFVEPIEISFEHKKLMVGDIGPNTGEMGTSMYWTDKNSRLYKETIDKVVPFLRKEGYVGYFDINCIATENELYPLEPTCRFGYPTIMLKMETIQGNLGEQFYEIACGVDIKLSVSNKISVCVCVVMPPFPFKAPEVFQKYSADALVQLPKDLSGIYLMGVRLEEGKLLQTLDDGSVCVCSGGGRSIEEARAKAYHQVDQVLVPNKMYRTDIGAKWYSEISQLASWNWL